MNLSIIPQNGITMPRKIVALLQARSDSSRLPKKVLKIILDKPMIIHQLLRTSKSKLIDTLILVTSEETSDDELVSIVKDNGFTIFRGDKKNVLKRFYDAVADKYLNDDDIIVRLTGDCPLHDSQIIDEAIESFLNLHCDYLSNSVEPVYPDGFDVEVFTYHALKQAYAKAQKQSDLEHVTPYIRNSGEFSIKSLSKQSRYPNWRLTVDETKDFELVSKIFEYFGSNDFRFDDIVTLLEHNQELLLINNNIQRNEGYIKSIKEENNDN